MFHLVTGYAEGLQLRLCERDVDLLIARKFGPIVDERLNFEFLFDERNIVVAGSRSPWAGLRKITLAELVNEPWVLPPPGRGITSIAMEAFGASGLDYPRATVVTDSPQVQMSLLATGRFLTIFPASTIRFSAQRSKLTVPPVELPKAWVPPNGIVTLKNRTLSPVARLFIDTAREVAKPLVHRK